MTTVSSGQRPSPLAMLQNRLTSAVTAGTIPDADKDALSSALESIDSALQASRPESGQRPDRAEMKAKVDSLIQDQVKAGTLTSDQADELKELFAKGPGGKGGPGGGPGGPGGPPPPDGGPQAADQGTASTDTSSDAILDFLKELLANRGSTTYGTTGTTTSSTTSNSLLVDYTA